MISKEGSNAVEIIKYGLPTFVLNRNLVHIDGLSKHLGFYPSSSGITVFSKELSEYETAKGSVKFPYNNSMPYKRIEDITRFRVAEQE